MPTILDANPSSSTFNAYATVAECDSYFDKRLHDSAWTSASTATKESAIMWATLQLDTLSWRGVPTSGTQPLQWPRRGMTYTLYASDGSGLSTTVNIADNEIPQALKNAVAELALSLIEKDSTVPPSSVSEGLTEIKVDTIALKYGKQPKYQFMTSTLNHMLTHLLDNQSPYNVPVKRVG